MAVPLASLASVTARLAVPRRAWLRAAASLAAVALLVGGCASAGDASAETERAGARSASARRTVAPAPAAPKARRETPPPAAAVRPAVTRTPPSPTPTLAPTPVPTPQPTPLPTPVFGREPTGPTRPGTVVAVVDGDTIDVNIGGTVHRVRYIGMDTPETHGGVEPGGAEASAANIALVEGREVVLETDVSETDRYGRLLRYVWLAQPDGWLLVNLELIRLGLAQVATYPPDVKYVDALFLPAQRDAHARGAGVWAAAEPSPAPAQPQPAAASGCEPSYPDVCVAPGIPDLDCAAMYAQGVRGFRVRWDVATPDPHRFDGNVDGVGCEG